LKNQYFADINDYRKYGLLRTFQSTGIGKLLVAWMLTPDDGRQDGRSRSYLKEARSWRRYDPELYERLVFLLKSEAAPEVSLIERSGLLQNTSYYSALVPDRREDRDIWRKGLLDAARDVDWVFLDPDNGIEVPSRLVGRKGSSKYVTWIELQDLWNAGFSLLIYQHFRRESRGYFARRLASELMERTGASFVEAFRTPHVLFLLAAQNRHAQRFVRALPLLSERWDGQIEAIGLANNS
jgi:hypothetical protein